MRTVRNHRVSEACFVVIVEYLEHYTSDILPYNAVKTLNQIGYYLSAETAIHPIHQIRLANKIHGVFAVSQSMELLDGILRCSFWDIYAEGEKTEEEVKAHLEQLELYSDTHGYDYYYDYYVPSPNRFWPWLDNPDARNKIEEAFAGYQRKLTSTTESSRTILPRLQKILQGFDCWHPEPDVGDPSSVVVAEGEQSISKLDQQVAG
jgi:hypothetical protein